jgi:hypothetical protein
MKKINLLLIMLVLLFFPLSACTGQEDTEPTAIVIDAETGRPIEGAVVLAQWYYVSFLGLGLGSTLGLDKAAETFSDRKGHVYIDYFWKSKGFNWRNNPKPRLTVYKPGYVLWDSHEICPIGKRTDFDEKHRTVKLLKFETEAARWLKKGYDKGRGGPRAMHGSFFRGCYSTENINEIKFREIFYKYEKPLDDAEEMARREKEKLKSK